jgi:hypothetical protein
MHNSLPKSGVLKVHHPSDPNKSCTVHFDNYPDGQVKIMYGDGRMYEGNVSKRSFAPEGKGVAYFPDNSHYEGEF